MQGLIDSGVTSNVGTPSESDLLTGRFQHRQNGGIRHGAAGRKASTQNEGGAQQLQPKQETTRQPDRRQDSYDRRHGGGRSMGGIEF